MKRIALIAVTAIALTAGMATSADAAPYRDCPGRVWGWKHEVDPQTTTCQLGRYALVVYLRELQQGGVPRWIWARSLKTGLTYDLHLVSHEPQRLDVRRPGRAGPPTGPPAVDFLLTYLSLRAALGMGRLPGEQHAGRRLGNNTYPPRATRLGGCSARRTDAPYVDWSHMRGGRIYRYPRCTGPPRRSAQRPVGPGQTCAGRSTAPTGLGAGTGLRRRRGLGAMTSGGSGTELVGSRRLRKAYVQPSGAVGQLRPYRSRLLGEERPPGKVGYSPSHSGRLAALGDRQHPVRRRTGSGTTVHVGRDLD